MFEHRGAIFRELSEQRNTRPEGLCSCVAFIKTIKVVRVLKFQNAQV
jgi:hypothetical protein